MSKTDYFEDHFKNNPLPCKQCITLSVCINQYDLTRRFSSTYDLKNKCSLLSIWYVRGRHNSVISLKMLSYMSDYYISVING